MDWALVMSVEPGFGGQQFMESSLEKIQWLKKNAPKLDIAVDGGINEKTAKLCAKAGANVLIAGSYIFKAQNRKKAVESLR
jgi:ribulose-phosphate 3-epimerase